ncbi:hypothetical protein EV121DRAFT_285087 [Schizophyllum commune]
MYPTNQRSRLPHRTPASQHGANRFAPYCPSPHILFAPRLSTIPLPDVPFESSNASPVTSMLASSAQTVPSQVVHTTLAGPVLSTIASQLAHQSQPLVQQGPSALTTAAPARPSLTKAACHSSVVPHDSAPPPATSNAVASQPVAGAARHSPAADADAPSLPDAADVQNTADNTEAQSSSSAPRFGTASRRSLFKDGHVELGGAESFAGGICVLPVLAPWEDIRSLTVTCPITINDLHLILYQATKLEKATFASIVEDTKKRRCSFEVEAASLQELTIGNVQMPIGSVLDDVEAPILQQIRIGYASAPAHLDVCADEQSLCHFVKEIAQGGLAGKITIISNDSWYKARRAQELQKRLKAVTRSTWIADVQ